MAKLKISFEKNQSNNPIIKIIDFGLSEKVVRDISALKEEPEWMTEYRVKAYNQFKAYI